MLSAVTSFDGSLMKYTSCSKLLGTSTVRDRLGWGLDSSTANIRPACAHRTKMRTPRVCRAVLRPVPASPEQPLCIVLAGVPDAGLTFLLIRKMEVVMVWSGVQRDCSHSCGSSMPFRRGEPSLGYSCSAAGHIGVLQEASTRAAGSQLTREEHLRHPACLSESCVYACSHAAVRLLITNQVKLVLNP